MLEKENPCTGCENNCCRDFRLYWTREEINQLILDYPFLSVVDTGVGFMGASEAVYRVMRCERLQDDGSCEDYPDGRPAFCENTGIKNRPAINCKFNDATKK